MATSMWKVSDGVTLKEVIRIARNYIGLDWTTLARSFGMSKTEIDAIRNDNRDNLVEQIAQCFDKWEMQNGKAATAQAFVDCLLEEMPRSQVVQNLKKCGCIERRGLGGPIIDSSTTQSRSSFPSLESLPRTMAPVQESSPRSLVPVQESSPKLAKPPSLGIGQAGIDEGEEIEKDTPKSADIEDGLHDHRGCFDEAVDSDKKKRKITILKRKYRNKTGEGPFDENDMIEVEEGFGVVKVILLVNGDRDLMAGIEMEEPVPGGGNGTFEGKSYFMCEDRLGLFVPYEKLHADVRFGDVQEEPQKQSYANESASSTSDVQAGLSNFLSSLAEEPSVKEPLSSIQLPINDAVCKYPGCNKPKFKDTNGKELDYCGKTHSKAHSLLLSEASESVAISSEGPTCIRFVIPQDCTGLVIGKGGKNILKVQSATNTSIQISSNSIGGKTEGRIIGSQENCTKAAIEIMECIKEKRAMHTATTRNITVLHKDVGRVIGKGGNTIRYIKAESGVQDIEFEKSTGLEGPNHLRKCSITGSDDQIEKAIKLIQQAQDGEDIVTSARLAAMFASFGFQIKDDTETVHTPSADQCVVS